MVKNLTKECSLFLVSGQWNIGTRDIGTLEQFLLFLVIGQWNTVTKEMEKWNNAHYSLLVDSGTLEQGI